MSLKTTTSRPVSDDLKMVAVSLSNQRSSSMSLICLILRFHYLELFFLFQSLSHFYVSFVSTCSCLFLCSVQSFVLSFCFCYRHPLTQVCDPHEFSRNLRHG